MCDSGYRNIPDLIVEPLNGSSSLRLARLELLLDFRQHRLNAFLQLHHIVVGLANFGFKVCQLFTVANRLLHCEVRLQVLDGLLGLELGCE